MLDALMLDMLYFMRTDLPLPEIAVYIVYCFVGEDGEVMYFCSWRESLSLVARQHLLCLTFLTEEELELEELEDELVRSSAEEATFAEVDDVKEGTPGLLMHLSNLVIFLHSPSFPSIH